MAKIWSIRGVPLSIHTTIFDVTLRGLNLLIEQKEINKPSGKENKSVSIKRNTDNTKPFESSEITSENINYLSASVLIPTSYLAARAVIVPSAYFAFKNASRLSLRSLPFLRPTANTSSP